MKLGNLRDLLPEYPTFVGLRLEHVDPLRAAVNAFEPYSDWSASGLWSWGDDVSLCRIGENLVLSLPDYSNGEPVTSLLGDDDVGDAAMTILNDGAERLALVPEPVALTCMQRSELAVTEDPDNHDYVLDPKSLATGGSPRRRTQFRQFERDHGAAAETVVFDLSSQKTALEICGLFDMWASIRERTQEDVGPERRALTRLLDLATGGQDGCFATGVRVDGELRAFVISELHDPPWLTGHFVKADITLKGLGVFNDATHFTALLENEQERSFARFNFMQDLGIPGLREHKLRLRPIGQLRKYVISPKKERNFDGQ